MAVLDGDLLPAMYFLTLFLLEQYRFLELQEAYIFDNHNHAMKLCPKVPFMPHRSPTGSQAEHGYDCAICQVDPIGIFEEVYKLPCKHQFHRWCLINWLCHMGKSKCPMCRDTILAKDGLLGVKCLPYLRWREEVLAQARRRRRYSSEVVGLTTEGH
ncbi:hypothetical protein G647_02743 [Cladophialophora carrionii CBS 160.54]|uniref:RING-type domain-containing protein n=1 Tax=Cladophialophora carrionii CBS 160.54 TaxID=1279043 RepID=V9DH21_9EURO|nr:uncharacterized protein G647_02743 [Cladophialophora carrionii CBS 160.54]ETI25966.1 hypothetical protein G647_02743 [Cladophialophora carrionii CBS 160.54]